MSSELRVDKIVPVDGVPTGGGGGVIQVVSIALHLDLISITNGVNYYDKYLITNTSAKFTLVKY